MGVVGRRDESDGEEGWELGEERERMATSWVEL